MSKFDLNNKTSLVTGAAGLLGRKHCEALLENNANLIITDINEVKLNELYKELSTTFERQTIIPFKMDITNKTSIENVSNILFDKNMLVDILINNAAIDPKVSDKDDLKNSSRLENISLEEWNNQIDVGLTGAFLCTQVFGSIMAKSLGKGVIVNISSDLSLIAPDQRLYDETTTSYFERKVKPVTYSVVKSGIVGFTKYVSTYWADKGVRCNSLSPGGVYNGQNENFVNKLSSLIPIGRMANIDEYKSAIQFLCSDASSYMNGHNLVIDGGRSVW